MKILFSSITVVLALSTPSYAALIDFGTFTRDTSNSLDWLDVTTTQGMSFNQVTAAYSGSEWRYATVSEFSAMANANLSPTTPVGSNSAGSYVSSYAQTYAAQSYYGTTSPNTTTGLLLAPAFTSGVAIGQLITDVNQLPTALDLKQTILFGHIVITEVAADPDYAAKDFGSYLVRNYKQISAVPVPAAAFMFAPALLGFMGLRRKAKNKAI